jgi:hypothetical protein
MNQDRSWLFNGSVENETKLKPLCQQVEALFQLPARRLCRYFATTEDLSMLRNPRLGENYRGVHIPYAARHDFPNLRQCFLHQQVGFSNEDPKAFDNLIYIRASTCVDLNTGFVTTYAHELQHFVQHGTLPRLWAANGVLSKNLKRLEPKGSAL